MKKLITAAAAAAMLGGLLLAPNAMAHDGDNAAETGHCDESASLAPVNDAAEGVVGIYGEQPGDGQGCLVLEGEGTVPVHPLDDGHIGVYEDSEGNPGLYGSCTEREDEHFNPYDPTASGGDDPAEVCNPQNDDTP